MDVERGNEDDSSSVADLSTVMTSSSNCVMGGVKVNTLIQYSQSPQLITVHHLASFVELFL